VLSLTVQASWAGQASAQSRSTTVGVVAGYVHNDQLWSRDVATDAVGGLVVGAWANVPTGIGWFSITAEGTYTQRGGDAMLDDEVVAGAVGTSPIRADYITVSVHPRATAWLGPVRVHLTTGPTLDQLIRSRLDPVLVSVLEDATSTVFGWTAGVGLGGTVTRGVVAEAELRIVEGLGDAYSGPFISLRNRSIELVGRVGIPWRPN
jgi:hypothetical protein